jgi:plastocyanin
MLLVPGVLLADDAVPPAQPEAQTQTQPAPDPPSPPAQEQTKQPPPAPVGTGAKKQAAPRKKDPKVHAAAAGSVTIQNFAFAPPTINVNAGDTVTWTNRDSTAHTATGNGGSFNTGVLKKGQSGSHTFAKAGRFAYICAIHPNMKGTVVVSAVSSSAGSSPAQSSGASPSAAPAKAAAKGPTLPNTGIQLGAVALIGALLTVAGMALRRLELERG